MNYGYLKSDQNNYEPLINVTKILLQNYTRTHKPRHDLSFESLKDLIYSTALIKMYWTEFEFVKSSDDSNLNNLASQEENCFDKESSISNLNSNKSPTKRRSATKKNSNKQSTDEEDTNQNTSQSTDKYSCLLITLSKNGIIYFFQINQTESKLDCIYLNEWQPEQLLIKDMFYFKNYLILIYTTGQIDLIHFEFNLQTQLTDFNFSNLIKQRFALWAEEDCIDVDDLLIYEVNSLIHIVFTKINFIILKVLEKKVRHQSEKRRKNQPTNQSNRTALNHQINELQIKSSAIEEALFKMSSNGLCKLYNNNLLFSSIDGNYYKIEIGDNFKLKQKKFNFTQLTRENYCPMSLCATNDGYLCCTVSRVCVYFDHLELRDSTLITIFTPLTRKEVLNTIIKLIETKEDLIQFKHLHNLFECFKIYVLSNEKYNFNFKDYAAKRELNELTDFNLKVLRFALLCDQSSNLKCPIDTNILKFTFDEENENTKLDKEQTTKKSNENVDNKQDEESLAISNNDETIANQQKKSKQKLDENLEHYTRLIKEIELILSVRHFDKFKANQTTAESKLTANQQRSMNLISNYLNSSNKKKQSNSKEQCPICKKLIELTDHHLASCTNAHQFTRCTHSLLICDLTQFDYRLCSLCKKLTFIYPLIWSSAQNSSFCLYCC